MSDKPLRPLAVQDLVGRDLTIEYHNASGHRSVRTIAVKFIEISKSGNVSLKGYCTSLKGLRTFRLDRIVNFIARNGARHHAPPLVQPLIQRVLTEPQDGQVVRDLRQAKRSAESQTLARLRKGLRFGRPGRPRPWRIEGVAGALVALLIAVSVLGARDMLPGGLIDTVRTELHSVFGTESVRETFSGRVTRIVDGDTFWISSRDVRIRIWGLDAPETHEPGGSAATAALVRLISGQTLECRQRDIDRYNRIVAQCFLADGRDITAAMIATGTATEYCHFSRNHYRTC